MVLVGSALLTGEAASPESLIAVADLRLRAAKGLSSLGPPESEPWPMRSARAEGKRSRRET